MTKKQLLKVDGSIPWKSIEDIPLEVLNDGWFYYIEDLSQYRNTRIYAHKILGVKSSFNTDYVLFVDLEVSIKDLATFWAWNKSPLKEDVFHCHNLPEYLLNLGSPND